MPESSYRGQQYRLRAGSPMPIGGSSGSTGSFVLHTFMAEVTDIEVVSCTESLPASRDFKGQGGDLMSASYARLNTKAGTLFSGKKLYSPTFVDEDDI